MSKKIILLLVIFTIFFVGNLAFAQDGLVPCGKTGPDGKIVNECNFDQFLILIVKIYNYLLLIVAPIATASIAYAGILYAFYSTNDSKRKQAHDIITSAVWGLALALAGYLIITQLFKLLVTDPTIRSNVLDRVPFK